MTEATIVPTPPRAATVMCVLYAAKSTEDRRGSIPTQLQDCRDTLAHRHDGVRRVVAGEYHDEGKSAYSANRGAGLAAAKRHAAELARDQGAAELWVQHSDRLARGDGLAADHLAEIFFAMRRAGVRLRSVQDDSNLEDVIRVALIGERNTEDSRRKSEAVRAGKRRQLQRGQRIGGPVPDGYLRTTELHHGNPVTVYVLDPERAPIIGRAFELAAENVGDPTIARTLNREGHRTKARKPWRRRRIQDLLTNPHYAGRVALHRGTPDEQINDGQHPALVDPNTFDYIQALRRSRDRAVGSPRHPAGRPSTRYVLARLARCARCGEGMYGTTSTYTRKDGTKARHYTCPSYADSTGGCDQRPIDATLVDAAIIDHLGGFFLDFDTWQQSVLAARQSVSADLEQQIGTHTATLEKTHRRATRLRERWVAAVDADDAQLERAAADAIRDCDNDLRALQARLDDLTAGVQEERPDPADELLDLYADLRRAIDGSLHDGTIVDVNTGLRDLFSGFWLDQTPAGVSVLPKLRPGIGAVFAYDPFLGEGHLLQPSTADDPLAAITESVRPPIKTLIVPPSTPSRPSHTP